LESSIKQMISASSILPEVETDLKRVLDYIITLSAGGWQSFLELVPHNSACKLNI